MPKRYKILFSEQAPTQYFTSFCRITVTVIVHALANVRCFLKKNPSITAPKCTESTFCVTRVAYYWSRVNSNIVKTFALCLLTIVVKNNILNSTRERMKKMRVKM